jgi:hypothetical protein
MKIIESIYADRNSKNKYMWKDDPFKTYVCYNNCCCCLKTISSLWIFPWFRKMEKPYIEYVDDNIGEKNEVKQSK